MADRGKKESTPPPLLLMPAGGGLTLTPPDQPNILMPVIQSEPALIDEDAEADSFVGQSPPAGAAPFGGGPPMQQRTSSTPTKVNYFQEHHGASDPFAQVGQFPAPPAPPSLPVTSASAAQSPMPPPSSQGQMPPGGSVLPPGQTESGGTPPPWAAATTTASDHSDKGSTNIYRQKGPLRYAPPPSGTYASGPTPGPYAQPSAQPPPPPSFSTAPPSGFAPAPFMQPLFGDAGKPPAVGSSPGTSELSHSSRSLSMTLSQQEESSFGQLSSTFIPPAPSGFLPPVGGIYHPVKHHWCYMKTVVDREMWYTFSRLDSSRLEDQYQKELHGGSPEVVSTDGGRYDVEVGPRLRRAIYWDEEPTVIRRCSWFYKRERDNRYVPYDEAQAERLETEYKNAIERNDWHRRLEFPGNETIVMHSPTVMVHYTAASQPDEWGNVQHGEEADQRPRVVKRGVEDFESIDDGEPEEVDHLVFFVHGIGEMCNTGSRSIVESVDEFRSIAHSLMKSHFGPYLHSGHVHRVEFLPVHWSMALHSDATGVDSRLNAITLPSTSKLRHFFNLALMDVLFYTSPAYCQIIVDTAGLEMNRLFQIFLARNPTFSGEVSVAGHSLGSSIVFDLLANQRAVGVNFDISTLSETDTQSEASLGEADAELEQADAAEETIEEELTLEGLLEKVGLQEKMDVFHREQIDLESLSMCSEQDLKDLGLPLGPRKKLQLVLQEEKGKKEKKTARDMEKKIRRELKQKIKAEKDAAKIQRQREPSRKISVNFICGLAGGIGQPSVRYPQLEFSPSCLFALGSPIGVFLSTRGVENMGENFHLPTCPRFFNIFHPLDPVAYRLEPMINSSASTLKPVLIPHYKGRKRLHLELKDSLARMGTDLKQKIVESFRSTWNSLNQFARAHRVDDTSHSNGDHTGLENEVDKHVDSVMAEMVQHDADGAETSSICSSYEDEVSVGQLNEGRRVDYVLQEKPIESFNDYLFALASHQCYWSSEDTALMMLKEIYMPLGIRPLMPGPDGTMPKASFPPPAGPPLKSMAPYPHQQVFPRPSGSLDSPLSQPPPPGPSGPVAPPPMGAALTNQHIQGPMKRAGSPFMSGGLRPGSQASSRGSTPPLAALSPQQGQEGMSGPPPMSGFVRSSPLH